MSKPSNNVIRHQQDGPTDGVIPFAEFDQLSVAELEIPAGQSRTITADTETAWLLMNGKVSGDAGDEAFRFERHSLFDESASCVHVCAGTEIEFHAETDCEFTVYRCNNSKTFDVRLFGPDQVPNEYRGKGQVAGRCLRFVRTIFDGSTSPADAELVLGEVVTLPGGWSSYPPHHHRQPEIYHYRFTKPEGYGHAELGQDVFSVRNRDTVCIPPGLDHAQCAAPGYGMYYSWVIRHLPDDPYTVPDFTEEHAWTMDPDADYWWPGDVPRG